MSMFRNLMIARAQSFADIDFVLRITDAASPWKTFHSYPAGRETNIDWGDGTVEPLLHLNEGYQNHVYAAPGDYHVKVESGDGITYWSFNPGNNFGGQPCAVNRLHLPDLRSAWLMFYGISNSFELPSDFHLAPTVSDVRSMFQRASNIRYFPPANEYWENSAITSFSGAFSNATWILNNVAGIPADWK